MDEFIDSFLPGTSWPDMNASAKSYGGEEKGPSICMIPSSMENAAGEGLNMYGHDGSSSIFIDANLKYGISNGLFPGENFSQQEIPNHTSHPSQNDNKTRDGSFSLQGMIKSNSTAGSFVPELNSSCPLALPHNTLTMSSSIESSGSEPSAFPASLGDSHSISSVPAMWHQSYSDVSFMGHGKLQGFGFQGVESDAVRKASLGNGKYPQLDDLPAASIHDSNHLLTFSDGQQKFTSGLFQHHQQEQSELHNLHMPFFPAGSQMVSSKTTGVQTHQQLSQLSQGNTIKHHVNHSSGSQSQLTPANASACNGVVKPRVRARRGQATDPHSIAERLRREKIAERMKHLLELVPNSNKTDKASMLDEIIDYVKFLQLQVKVLSMSRLGAAGAVVPLITDVQSEGSGSLFLSSSVGQRVADVSDSQDNLAFEQEIVKLMESSITTAMQYLQNKGLCLMPIALASAISNQKGSSLAAPHDRRKHEMTHGLISPSSLGLMERNGGDDGPNGGLVKQE